MRGTETVAPFSSRRVTTYLPRKPAPPVTSTFLPDQKSAMLPPVVQDVLEGLLEGDEGLPPGFGLELGVVAVEDLDIAGAHARRVLLRRHFDITHLEERIEDILNWVRRIGTDVVDLARPAFLHRQKVATHRVPDVREVALGGEVADEDDGLLAAILDVDNLLGEVGGDEDMTSSGPSVVEGPR